MRGWGLFFFLLFLLLIFAAVGWVIYTQLRARRQGLPPPSWKSYIPFLTKGSSASNYPSPRSSGPFEWVKDQIGKLTNKRTARGAYEETGDGGAYAGAGAPAATGARRGRGLEDDAWDTRVGNEDPYGPGPGGYYEEQELGLAPTPGLHAEPYGGGAGSDYVSAGAAGRTGYGESLGYEEAGRGRSKSREPNLGGSGHLDPNPFGDQNEAASLRSVSPRPEVDTRTGHVKGNASLDTQQGNTSPTSRRSMFSEGL